LAQAKTAMRYALPAVLAITLLARLAYILLFGHTLHLDTSGYDVYAVNLMAGHGYTRFADLQPDSDLPPLYAFFLVGVYGLLGRGAIQVAIVQAMMDVISVAFVYLIGRRVGGELVGLLAAFFTGIYPYLLFQGVTTNDTAIFLLLLSVAIYGIYRIRDGGGLWWVAIVGLAVGVGALTKTLVLLIAPLAALWWWRWLGFPRAFARGVIFAAVSVAVLAPWVYRNTQLHGHFTLISTNDGSNLHQGNNTCVADYLAQGWDAQWVRCLPPTPSGLNELEESRWHRDQAITYLRENPSQWARLFGIKLYTLWSIELLPRTVPPMADLGNDFVLQYETPLFQAARVIHILYWGPLLLAALWGWFRATRAKAAIAPLLMVCLAITIAYVIYHPSTRYRSPADPFVFVLSAYALAPVVSAVLKRWRAKVVTT
jgi:4-amino-4-deoxy-L-arabinose transferase-like glycosyltransferase